MRRWNTALITLFLAGALVGCNSETDDPDFSEAIVSAVNIEPTQLLSDWVEREEPGQDGQCRTPDDELLFETDSITVTLRNDARSPLAGGGFANDVIIDTVDIEYQPSGSPRDRLPPDRFDTGVNRTVALDDETTFSIIVVLDGEKSQLVDTFEPESFGEYRANVTLTFHGRDIGGDEPMPPVQGRFEVVFNDFFDEQCQDIDCGNGIPDTGEECDDGNRLAGDGCGPTCLVERCGNGFLDLGEGCDDGNLDNGDGCSALCQLE